MGLRISAVSKSTGVPASTLRYYESLGLLKPQRSQNGYRAYGADVLERLRFIEAAKAFDLSLGQIAELVVVWERESCGTVQATLAPVVRTHLAHLDVAAADLAALRALLAGSLRHLDALVPRDEPCGQACALIADTTAGPPLVCKLNRADHEGQVARWHRLLERAEVDRAGLGVRVRVGAADVIEAAIVAQRERECCQFLTISMVFVDGGCLVSVDAPPSAPDVLEEIFGASAV